MKNKFLIILFYILAIQVLAETIKSPKGNLTLDFKLTDKGEPVYQLTLSGKPIITQSKLGIELKDMSDLAGGFTISQTEKSEKDEIWQPVWGEIKRIRNHYNELAITLQKNEDNHRRMIIRFRLFDDGLGFRYEFPKQQSLGYFILSDEKTEFHLTGDHKTFWLPGDYDSQEYTYSITKLSEVDAYRGKSVDSIITKTIPARNIIQTPLMMKSIDGLYINLHEAALINYPAMQLMVDTVDFKLTSHLVPDVLGNKAYLQTPCTTPWRTIVVSDKATDILSSKLILNLNEPTRLKDVSWIKPQKFIGIWWELHVGKSSWNYADVGNIKLSETDWSSLKPNGRHGATTKNTKRYIDFASKHGIDGVLVEGWNVGWEDWFGNWKEDVFDFVTPYPDFNVVELQKYAAAKGVKLIMHHETSASATNYERRMDEAFHFMKKHGYDSVKTGYVGRIIPRGEHHDGQWMVNHYNHVAEKAAKYKIMVDAHEPVRPTGLQRTYPNWLASEAARGNEFNAWSEGNPPEHETILPFTRLMGGPMDYTPGIFQIKMDFYNPNKKEQVHTTLAKQLALYVTLYSPLQMAADLPENYEKHLDAFQFIKDVAVDWDDTKILEAEPGEYITIARKAKNKNEWYVGSITNGNSRDIDISLDFLPKNQQFLATIYKDAPDADWEKNPMAYKIQKLVVNNQSQLKIYLASGGGTAISLKPTKNQSK